MGTPFFGELRLVSFHFAPRGWALCDGQLLPINQNQALYAILGTRYGGDGQATFALPDLRGRHAVHVGSRRTLGESGGTEAETLLVSQLPTHSHGLRVATAATANAPTAGVVASPGKLSFGGTANTVLHAGTVGNAGGGHAHNNRSPYLVLNYVIALQGIFPSQA